MLRSSLKLALVRRLRFWLVKFPALSICQLDRVLVVTSTQHQIPIVAVISIPVAPELLLTVEGGVEKLNDS